jgi:hypothetical protein
MKSAKFLLVVAASLLLARPLLAQTGPQLMLKPFPKDLSVDLSVIDVTATEDGHSKESGDSIGITIADTQGRIRLNPGDEASPRLGYEFKYFNVDSTLPGMPNNFYDQSIGVAVPVAKTDNWIFGVSIALGYAGQSPFGDGNGWYGRADAVAVKKFDETSGIAIVLDYDGNRTYKPDTPLPGFAYFRRISDKLTMTVGLPLTSIEWEPIKHLRIRAQYELTDNYGARIGYEFTKGWEVFGALGQRTDAFFFDHQRYGDDRLFFQQRQAELGVTYRMGQGGVGEREVEFTAAVGYAFSRELSVGFDSSNSRLIADVSDEPYVRFGFQIRY